MIDMVRNLPAEDKTLLAAAASLVVRDTIHPDWIRLLLMAATSVHRAGSVPEVAGDFPSEAHLELPLSEQARRYLQTGPTWLERRFPFWLAGVLDRLFLMLLPIVTVLFPLFGFVLPTMDRRQRARIGRWYAILRDVEHSCASASPEVVERQLDRLRALQAEVARLRTTPALHLGELYHLRTHIEHALTRLEQQRAAGDRSYDIGRISA
jgi:hypothetical protein